MKEFLIGKEYNRLTVVADLGLHPYLNEPALRRRVFCRCTCGKVGDYLLKSLKNNLTKSCGCLNSESRIRNGKLNVRHGELKTPTWWSWMCMKRRVLGKDLTYNYKMTMDPRWEVYENFRDDMGYRPSGTTLDKEAIDPNNTHYCKELCRWTTAKEQCSTRGRK